MRRFWLSLLCLNVLFLALAWPSAWSQLDQGGWLPVIALEALVLTGMFALLPRHSLTRWLAYLCGLMFVIATLLIGFDLLVTATLGRNLNLYLDFSLLRSAWDLSLSNLGSGLTFIIVVSAALLIVGFIALIGRVLFALTQEPLKEWRWQAVSVLGVGVVLLVLQVTGVATAAGLDILRSQAAQAQTTRQGHTEFVAQLDTLADNEEPAVLSSLQGRDVILVFVESYGREALVDPGYAPIISQRLQLMAEALETAELGVVSGMVKAPIQGGQSWLAHASLLSGEWIANQLDYEGMLDSQVPTLITDFNASGHQTVAVMPANTRDWPMGDQYGYDSVFDSRNMDYQGPAFNFMTMPDQYTLHWFEQQVRQPSMAPIFAELALISSHAPWVPVLPILDWDTLDNGTVYAAYTEGHPTPEAVFRDNVRVREFYVQAVDYTLQAVTEYAARYLGPEALLIVVGDHEAPPLVTHPDVDRSVPMHIISGNAELLAPWIEDTARGGWRTGTLPDANTDALPMDGVRALLHQYYD